MVTTGTFSLPARSWAEGKLITLVDGNDLCDWVGIVKPPDTKPIQQQKIKKPGVQLPTFKMILIFIASLIFFLAVIFQLMA